MRWVSAILPILLLILGMASPALAADYDLPILRGSSQPPAPVVTVGPATFTRWSRFYFGGNVSLGSATSDFSTATRPLVQFSLQHTTVESSDQSFGFSSARQRKRCGSLRRCFPRLQHAVAGSDTRR